MTVLVPMTETEFAAYADAAMAEYAGEKVASGAWAADAAGERAQAEFKTLLPQGIHTPGHFLFTLRAAGAQAAVGALWFAVQAGDGSRRVAFVYDVHVDAAHRRQGHATRAFGALEDKARELGAAGIALHVFGHNSGAQALYAALGYRATDIQMFKPLGGIIFRAGAAASPKEQP